MTGRYHVYAPNGDFVGAFDTLEAARLAAEEYTLPGFAKILDTKTMTYVE